MEREERRIKNEKEPLATREKGEKEKRRERRRIENMK